MIRHFKIWVSVLGIILVALIIYFAGSLYLGGCSYHNNCEDGGRSQFTHTPISTLVPATLQENAVSFPYSASIANCTVNAETLLSAWVSSGYPESLPFKFSDLNNVACEATFSDVQSLFTEPNLWYPGALACTSCHNAALSDANSARLDLSSYTGVVTGSRRSQGTLMGGDILGGGDWKQSKLYQVLFILHQMPYGIPSNGMPASGPTILAGLPVSVAEATPTEVPVAEEIARPDNSGGPGSAIDLTGDAQAGKQIFVDHCQMCHGEEGKDDVLNPGSDDGTVPPLNPIDSTLINSDYKIYAYNLDLFIENGSRPAGPNPARFMPPWGAQNALTQQEIADVIAYIISLNKP